MKLRHLYLIPAWLLVKMADMREDRETNEMYRKMSLGEYSRRIGALPYVASFLM